MDGEAWWATVRRVTKSQTGLSDFTFTFHFHALEKEMATHSSVLAWRIPGAGAWWAAVYGVTQSWTRRCDLAAGVKLYSFANVYLVVLPPFLFVECVKLRCVSCCFSKHIYYNMFALLIFITSLTYSALLLCSIILTLNLYGYFSTCCKFVLLNTVNLIPIPSLIPFFEVFFFSPIK